MPKKAGITPFSVDALCRGSLSDPLAPGLRIESLASGKKKWKYHRRLSGGDLNVKLTLGSYPAHTIAEAREWARTLNVQVEAGIDSRETKRLADERATMTVARAHSIYIEAAREGRASRAKRVNKPRTIAAALAPPLVGYAIQIHGWQAGYVARVFTTAACGAALLGTDILQPLAAILLIDFSIGAEVDILAYLVSRRFPPADYARRFSLVYSAFMAGGGLSPLLAALLYERAGGYEPFFLISALLLLTVAAAFATLDTRRRRRRRLTAGDMLR